MAEIDTIMGVLNRIKSVDVSVNPYRCVTVRNRQATCKKCAEACTSGSIHLTEGAMEIDEDKCVGCGTCATVCPTCALEAKNPADEELRAAAYKAAVANGGVAVFACHPMVEAVVDQLDRSKVIGVECMGRVDESLLVDLAARGITAVTYVKGDCATCPQATGLKTMQDVFATTEALLDVWNHPIALTMADKFPGSVRAAEAPEYDEDRRNFFFSTRQKAKDVAVAVGSEVLADPEAQEEEPQTIGTVLKVMDDGTLPHFIPNRREHLLDALASLGEPKDELIETRLWGHVIIDVEKCESCQMCATFCPTGAIAKFDEGEEGAMGIDHFPGDCVKCRCCEDICPAQAITLSDEVFAADLLTGAVERVEMKRPKILQSNPKKAMWTFRELLGCEDIYER